MEKQYEKIKNYLNSRVTQTEKNLVIYYYDALKQIKFLVSELFVRYGVENTLPYEEMTRNEQRLLQMERELEGIVNDLVNKKDEVILKESENQYTESYLRNMFLMEKTTGMKIFDGMINVSLINKIIQHPVDGITLNERLSHSKGVIARDIKRTIIQGMIQGKSYQKMAKDLQKRMEVDLNKAVQIVRTESHRVSGEARLDSMKKVEEKGISMKKMWVAALDHKTRKSHSHLDGVKISVDESFVVGSHKAKSPGKFGVPELDINCRCDMVSIFDDEQLKELKRRDGNGSVTNYKNYDEWIQKNPVTKH